MRKCLQISGLNFRPPTVGGGGEVFIFVAADPATKAWLQKTLAETTPWEEADLKVGGVGLLRRMLEGTA